MNSSEVRENRSWAWLVRVRRRITIGGEHIFDSNVMI